MVSEAAQIKRRVDRQTDRQIAHYSFGPKMILLFLATAAVIYQENKDSINGKLLCLWFLDLGWETRFKFVFYYT